MKNLMKLPVVTVLLSLVMGAGVARADYTYLAMPGINTLVNGNNTLSSFGTVSGAPVPASGSSLGLNLNVSSTSPQFSSADIYASLVHLDPLTPANSPFSVFLNGTSGLGISGAGAFAPTLSLGLASSWLVNGSLNGDWGLLIDTTRTGASFTVNSWSLVSTPEPGQLVAMAFLLGAGGLVFLGRRCLQKA